GARAGAAAELIWIRAGGFGIALWDAGGEKPIEETRRPPVASAVGRAARPNIDPAEWEQRVNLAACYRLVEHFGWTDLIYTHISARVPGEPGHFLLNRFGLLFDEVTASNLI